MVGELRIDEEEFLPEHYLFLNYRSFSLLILRFLYLDTYPLFVLDILCARSYPCNVMGRHLGDGNGLISSNKFDLGRDSGIECELLL